MNVPVARNTKRKRTTNKQSPNKKKKTTNTSGHQSNTKGTRFFPIPESVYRSSISSRKVPITSTTENHLRRNVCGASLPDDDDDDDDGVGGYNDPITPQVATNMLFTIIRNQSLSSTFEPEFFERIDHLYSQICLSDDGVTPREDQQPSTKLNRSRFWLCNQPRGIPMGVGMNILPISDLPVVPNKVHHVISLERKQSPSVGAAPVRKFFHYQLHVSTCEKKEESTCDSTPLWLPSLPFPQSQQQQQGNATLKDDMVCCVCYYLPRQDGLLPSEPFMKAWYLVNTILPDRTNPMDTLTPLHPHPDHSSLFSVFDMVVTRGFHTDVPWSLIEILPNSSSRLFQEYLSSLDPWPPLMGPPYHHHPNPKEETAQKKYKDLQQMIMKIPHPSYLPLPISTLIPEDLTPQRKTKTTTNNPQEQIKKRPRFSKDDPLNLILRGRNHISAGEILDISLDDYQHGECVCVLHWSRVLHGLAEIPILPYGRISLSFVSLLTAIQPSHFYLSLVSSHDGHVCDRLKISFMGIRPYGPISRHIKWYDRYFPDQELLLVDLDTWAYAQTLSPSSHSPNTTSRVGSILRFHSSSPHPHPSPHPPPPLLSRTDKSSLGKVDSTRIHVNLLEEEEECICVPSATSSVDANTPFQNLEKETPPDNNHIITIHDDESDHDNTTGDLGDSVHFEDFFSWDDNVSRTAPWSSHPTEDLHDHSPWDLFSTMNHQQMYGNNQQNSLDTSMELLLDTQSQ